MVDGSVGVHPGRMNAMSFSLETGVGFKMIRRGVILPGWNAEVDFDAIYQRLSDAKGN